MNLVDYAPSGPMIAEGETAEHFRRRVEEFEIMSRTAEGQVAKFCLAQLKIAAELDRHWYTRWLGRRARRSAESIWANRRDLWL